MIFDEWWDFDADSARCDNTHTQKLQDGRHTGDITAAAIANSKYQVSDANPNGTCLVVTWSKPGFYPVEAKAPVHWRGMIEAICRAAGVAPPRKGEDWDERSLVGRVATVDIETKESKAGNEYQRITRWHASATKSLPPAPSEPAKRPPKRTPTAKAHAEFQERAGEDDIPF